MPVQRDVAVIVGSLRAQSYTRKVAEAIVELAPRGLKFRFVQIDDLPLYNQDLETDASPAAWARFRDDTREAEAVLFATPEYNRSMTAAMKNALDVGSRPYGKSVFAGKPAAVVSASPGAISGFGANHHLRQSLVFVDMPVMQQPEAYITGVDKMFDVAGHVTDDSKKKFLAEFGAAFAEWIKRVSR